MVDPLAPEIFKLVQPDAPSPDGAKLGFILSELSAREVEEGGPYYVFLGKEEVLDFGFNLGVSLLLRKWGVQLPRLEAYLNSFLEKGLPVSEILSSDELNIFLKLHGSLLTPTNNKSQGTLTQTEELIFSLIRKLMDERFARLPSSFAESAKYVMERTIKGNPDKQMSLMSLYTKEALGENAPNISDPQIAQLGLANIFFWTAFIIYDDFWDIDEAAEPKLLPVANLFARHYINFFTSSDSGEENFRTFFNEYMDKLDSANEWEMLNCRMLIDNQKLLLPTNLPDYGNFGIKFYPASGHIFGPVKILLDAGYKLDSVEVKLIIEYFRGYLIAMQLNDDAHDWKEDLSRGHISTAVYLILRNWRQNFPNTHEIDLEKDMPELERMFWFDILPELCESIFEYCDEAQKALDEISCMPNPAPLQKFIDRNRVAAEQALLEQRQSVEILESLRY